ncbi:4'-phosphopantetheinyl transferase family protein [Pseudanabaena sp. Chao 1811]|uniref:4'-phosphopantetheinyl transferase family protein n=1 Tax=Pseudanabaena sp. Chao 1811 TaxID=2963092 RepID=UPI0022F4001A|nr:4'-phosphopantetheinyl transferase superfamily protein [Pseudanabaena sp. Chao 1811]
MTTDLQLYQARLDISEIECDRLWKLLSEDERSRADRFKRENLRRNFVAARGNLRIILAQWLGCKPKAIQFSYSDRGKPYLQNSKGIYFNLAHSQDFAIYVVSSDREVGIDLEYINPQCDIEGIAQRYFSPSEYEVIKGLGDRDPSLAVQAFYQAWTLKEAYGKATGQGITNILEGLDVSPLLETAIGTTLQIGDWNLKLLSTELELGISYAAALCINQRSCYLLP